jgi:Membrane fusion protein Use1
VQQRLAPASDVTSGPLNEIGPSAIDVDLLFGSAEKDSSGLPAEPSHNTSAATTSPLRPGISVPSLAAAADTAPAKALLQNSTAVQEELSSQLAQMAGQLRRNAEHFSRALVVDQAVLRDAEEKVDTNYDVMKRERVRLRDHRGKSIGTTCLTITSVLVVALAFVVMLFILRFT